MTRRRKLDDAQVAQLRARHAAGATQKALADELGVSRQHIARLVNDEQRPVLAPAGQSPSGGSAGGVAGAVDALVAGLDLDGRGRVLAETALALARKLDACDSSETAAAATAAPRVAAQLTETLNGLVGTRAGESSEAVARRIMQAVA